MSRSDNRKADLRSVHKIRTEIDATCHGCKYYDVCLNDKQMFDYLQKYKIKTHGLNRLEKYLKED